MTPRAFALVLALALLAAPAAHAAGPPCGSGGQLQPAGYQQITVSSTAVALTVPAESIYAVVVVGTNSIRWRDDGTDPTTSVGMPYGASSLPQTFTLCGGQSLARVRLIAVSTDSVVNVSYYKP